MMLPNRPLRLESHLVPVYSFGPRSSAPMTGTITPTHKALAAYYETLRSYGQQQVRHEGALETAFQRLLADTARTRGWTLVPKLAKKHRGKLIIPDGTLRDM